MSATNTPTYKAGVAGEDCDEVLPALFASPNSVMFKESSPNFEVDFPVYDPKQHHIDANYITKSFDRYRLGREQIALEFPLNLPSIRDCEIRAQDICHPVIGRNSLSPQAFRICSTNAKRPELPLLPPDHLLAMASERNLISTPLKSFLSRQLSDHQAPASFLSLNDGTLCAVPFNQVSKSAKHWRSIACPSSSRFPRHENASDHNLVSPIDSVIAPMSRSRRQEQQEVADKYYHSIGQKSITSPHTSTSVVSMKLFPVVDNRANVSSSLWRRASVPKITPMITNEELLHPNLSAYTIFRRPPYATSSNPRPSSQQHRYNTIVGDFLPGKALGQRRPSTSSHTHPITGAHSAGASQFILKEDFSRYSPPPSPPKEARGASVHRQKSHQTEVKRPTVRSSVGAWALDNSPAEEIIQKINHNYALPARPINFSCKKILPMHRSRSTCL